MFSCACVCPAGTVLWPDKMFTVSLWRWTAERRHFSAPIKKPLQTPTLMTQKREKGEGASRKGKMTSKWEVERGEMCQTYCQHGDSSDKWLKSRLKLAGVRDSPPYWQRFTERFRKFELTLNASTAECELCVLNGKRRVRHSWGLFHKLITVGWQQRWQKHRVYSLHNKIK